MQSYNPNPARKIGLGYSLFARHYSGNHYCFLFLSLLRCFSSGGWLSFEWYIFNVPGCPIRKSSDIMPVCGSPKLIAAYHVLHRLSDPRHPPCALICFKKIRIYRFNSVKHYELLLQLFIPNMSKNLFPITQKHLQMIWNWTKIFPNEFIYVKRTYVEDIGVEPMTLCVQGRCSSQLS